MAAPWPWRVWKRLQRAASHPRILARMKRRRVKRLLGRRTLPARTTVHSCPNSRHEFSRSIRPSVPAVPVRDWAFSANSIPNSSSTTRSVLPTDASYRGASRCPPRGIGNYWNVPVAIMEYRRPSPLNFLTKTSKIFSFTVQVQRLSTLNSHLKTAPNTSTASHGKASFLAWRKRILRLHQNAQETA